MRAGDGARARGAIFLWALLSCWVSSAALANPSYYRAEGETLAMALRDIAEGFGLALRARDLPPATMQGDYHFDDPASLMGEVARRHHLDWFLYRKTLFVSPPSLRLARHFDFPSVRERLEFLSVLEARAPSPGTVFPLSEEGESGLTARAPSPYLNRLSELYDEYRALGAKALLKGSDRAVMTFRLKHSWAADKEYRFEKASYTVPGIAALLRRLTGASDKQGGGGGGDESVAVPGLTGAPPLSPMEELRGAGAKDATPKPNHRAEASKPASPSAPPEAKPVIIADPRLNTILIYDRLEKRPHYQALIEEMDKNVALVHIEAVIVDVAKNKLRELGVSWRANDGDKKSAGFGALGESLVSDGAIGITWGMGGLATALAANARGLLAKLRLMETYGTSRIVSRPSVMTMDNLEARIDARQRYFVKVEGFQDSSLYPINVGTSLRVTPHIIRGEEGEPKRIQLFVSIEDGVIDESQRARIGELPRIQENTVHTQAVVSENGSLLIGGHVHSMTTDSVSKVPILGDIPILGYFFSSREKRRNEFVRLFIIRPRLEKIRPSQ